MKLTICCALCDDLGVIINHGGDRLYLAAAVGAYEDLHAACAQKPGSS